MPINNQQESENPRHSPRSRSGRNVRKPSLYEDDPATAKKRKRRLPPASTTSSPQKSGKETKKQSASRRKITINAPLDSHQSISLLPSFPESTKPKNFWPSQTEGVKKEESSNESDSGGLQEMNIPFSSEEDDEDKEDEEVSGGLVESKINIAFSSDESSCDEFEEPSQPKSESTPAEKSSSPEKLGLMNVNIGSVDTQSSDQKEDSSGDKVFNAVVWPWLEAQYWRKESTKGVTYYFPPGVQKEHNNSRKKVDYFDSVPQVLRVSVGLPGWIPVFDTFLSEKLAEPDPEPEEETVVVPVKPARKSKKKRASTETTDKKNEELAPEIHEKVSEEGRFNVHKESRVGEAYNLMPPDIPNQTHDFLDDEEMFTVEWVPISLGEGSSPQSVKSKEEIDEYITRRLKKEFPEVSVETALWCLYKCSYDLEVARAALHANFPAPSLARGTRNSPSPPVSVAANSPTPASSKSSSNPEGSLGAEKSTPSRRKTAAQEFVCKRKAPKEILEAVALRKAENAQRRALPWRTEEIEKLENLLLSNLKDIQTVRKELKLDGYDRSISELLEYYYNKFKKTARYQEVKREVANYRFLNREECAICQDVGNLICCEGCDSGFHLHCLTPPLPNFPDGDWYCPPCAKEHKKEIKEIKTWTWASLLAEVSLHVGQMQASLPSGKSRNPSPNSLFIWGVSLCWRKRRH